MSNSITSYSPRKTRDATIQAGESLSSAVYVGAGRLVALQMPTDWTSASVTLQGSLDGTNFMDLYDAAGTEIAFTVAPSHLVELTAPIPAALWLKIRSGTGGSPVNQDAERIITAVIEKDRPIGLG